MNDPTSDLEAWAATYRAMRRPSPARRRAIVAGVHAGAAAQDREIRRQRWLGIGVLLAAGIVGVLVLVRLLGGTATRLGAGDDRSMAPYSTPGGSTHSVREAEATPPSGAAEPAVSEPVVPEGTAVEAGALDAAKPRSRAGSERRRPGASEVDRASEPEPTAAGSAPDELESLRLLRDAERRLETDAVASLRLLERHEQRFPSSSLALEREALTVIALCRLGRIDAGRERTQAFLRRPGSSAYAVRLRSACDEAAAPAP